MANKIIIYLIFLSFLFITSCHFLKLENNSFPIGTVDNIKYAEKLWSAITKEKLVVTNALANKPFFGGVKLHGMFLELAYKSIQVDKHIGFVVKKTMMALKYL